MGCDIHPYLERRPRPDAPWEYVGMLGGVFQQRSYVLFGTLAGVRNRRREFTPLVENRGIPEDASPDIWEAYQGNLFLEMHSPSYLTRTEIKEALSSHTVTYRDSPIPLPEDRVDLEDAQGRLRNYLERLIEEMEPFEGEVRFVFWFDN